MEHLTLEKEGGSHLAERAPQHDTQPTNKLLSPPGDASSSSEKFLAALAEKQRLTQEWYQNEDEEWDATHGPGSEWAQDIERKQEEYRLKQEQEAADYAASLELLGNNQRRRRQLDIELPDLGTLTIDRLCHEGEEYAHEFYTEFFSLEYMGYFSVYSEHKKGYMLPLHPVYKNLLFSVTGSVWDLTDGWKKGPPIPEINFVILYGAFVCGYQLNKFDHMSPHHYRRAIYGYASWLASKKAEVPLPKEEDNWEELFTVITLGMFMDNDTTFKDRPRSVYKRIVTYHGGDVRHFEVLKDEDAFVEFLHTCCEGGENHWIGSHYFEVKDVGRVGVKKFQFTLNPACVPPTEEEAEKNMEAFRVAIPAALKTRVPKGTLAPK